MVEFEGRGFDGYGVDDQEVLYLSAEGNLLENAIQC